MLWKGPHHTHLPTLSRSERLPRAEHQGADRVEEVVRILV